MHNIDTALFYCDGKSEIAVGKALKGWRDKVQLSTKYPCSKDRPYRETLEKQLTKLDTDHIDFYHFHGIGQWFVDSEDRDQYLKDALQAKEEGLIRNISFSFHDKPEVMAKIIDLGVFSSVLCQYNLLDRANEDALANAKAHGLGKPVVHHLLFAASPAELVERVEEVRAVGGAATLSTAAAMALIHGDGGARDLIRDVTAKAAAQRLAGLRRDGGPLHRRGARELGWIRFVLRQ